MNTNQKGSIAEQKVILKAVEKGLVVSRPTSPCRYDLILDDGQTLQRVQVKYADGGVGAESSGSVCVNLRSWNHSYGKSRDKGKTYTEEEIDLVLAYIPKLDIIVKLGPELFEGKKALAIRIEEPKNGQSKGCNRFQDLEWK